MARKNPFANLMEGQAEEDSRPRLDYTIKGASKSILSSIDEIAARADKLLEGQTVVEIEPELIDSSFVRDRLAEDEQDYQDLLAAVREHGQDSPILLRPHPSARGRYMVIFGHRRVKVARDLGRKVRAVIKEMDDRAHVIAQGQENSARANLSFIEKAAFARELSRLGYDRDHTTVLSALAIDRATLSKMLSVVSIPDEILHGIGAAKGIGRDRWYELKMLLEKPSNLERAMALVESDDFRAQPRSDDRFNMVLAAVKSARKAARAQGKRFSGTWSSDDKRVSAELRSDGANYVLSLKARDAVAFGDFLARNLADFYEAYRKDRQE